MIGGRGNERQIAQVGAGMPFLKSCARPDGSIFSNEKEGLVAGAKVYGSWYHAGEDTICKIWYLAHFLRNVSLFGSRWLKGESAR